VQAAEENIRQSNERAMNMSRGGSRRGGDRGGEGSDGWAVAGNAAPRAPPKAGDLSRFGKIEKPASGAMTFGPSSVFNKKTDPAAKREAATMSRSASTSNAFSLLQSQEMAAEMAGPPASAKGSRPGSRKPSVDFGAGGAPEAGGQRRKLNLLPRTQPAGDKSGGTSPDQASTPVEDVEQAPAASMPESEAQRKIAEDMKEFFEIRNVDEGEDYFSKLPAEHRFRLVDKFVTRAIESKQSDAQLVADLFARAVEKNLCPADAFEQGFMPVAEMLDDIAIDAPKAFDLMAIMLKGAGLAGDEERRSRIAEKSMDSDKLLALLA
jgi:translation initiation factor 4G